MPDKNYFHPETPDRISRKQWVDNWQRLAPILADLEADELRSADYGGKLETFLSTIDWACEHATPRKTSGLVEQQRLFRIAKRQWGESE